MLTLHQLSCARGDRVLFSGANLTLSPGEALYVTGANGAGKTSLLRVVCGLAAAEHGDVLWNGEPIRKLHEEFSQQLLFLGHAAALKDELSALENLTISSAIAGRSVSEREVTTALRFFGLKGREHLPARALSAGQRRKVNLARLLLPDPPPLWVLDEPFTALDVKAVGQLAEIFVRHLKQDGMLIYTTHQDVVFPGCTVRQMVIDSGKVSLC